MQIKELTATFGRLENEILPLAPGLNVIQAPNEGGKSTWTAFLRAMLYGLNTRDRSPTAEKRRYMPWSGSAMQGRMDVSTSQGDLTVIRRTQRANSPMGAFSAVYAGTTTPAPGISATNCGEALLGVSQEIYERSAYIRQSGIAVDQNAALERRIASLITTGEEDTSYTDAADRLRKQLNRRQSNRVTGLIPQLTQEISAAQSALRELEDLEQALQRDKQALQALLVRQESIQRQLALHDAADKAQQAAQAKDAESVFHQAQLQAEAFKKLTADLPDKGVLASIRSDIAALHTLQQAVDDASRQAQEARRQLDQAEAALSVHSLAGMTPEAAAQAPASPTPRPALSLSGICLTVIAGAIMMGAVICFTRNWLAAIGSGLGLMGLLLLAVTLPLRRRRTEWDARQARAAEKRAEEVTAYTMLYKAATHAKETAQAAAAAHNNMERRYQASLEQLLSLVRSFRPDAKDLTSAQLAAEDGLRRYNALEQARRAADEARIRWETVADKAVEGDIPAAERPTTPRQQLEADLFDVNSRLVHLQRQLHTVQGRIQAVGDPAQLRAQLELTQQKQADLQAEYDAIDLASQVLAQANTALQNRFSPALGEKTAKIFTKLTKGKYNKVLLNRDMTPSAQEAGRMLPHEAAVLSQGAADQLYLAVRLAICQMVLPEENAAPILLDDALVTFDDDRMAAALDCLAELAEARQILLFTCQSRELNYLAQAHPGKYHAIHL